MHAVELLQCRGLVRDHVLPVQVVITKPPLGLNHALVALHETVVQDTIYQGVGATMGAVQEVVITVQRVRPISSKIVVVAQVQVLVIGVAAIVLKENICQAVVALLKVDALLAQLESTKLLMEHLKVSA